MKLNLTKPLVVFDLETTGLDIVTERIIQMSYIKVKPDGEEIRKNYFFNPEKPIPQLVQELTSITNEKVADAPTFRQMANKLKAELEGCDFAGFNSNRFDIPMLAEEFIRAQVDFDFSKCRLIDVSTIFNKMERRNLRAAYKFYCGKLMKDVYQAHLADEDTEATYEVLKAQLDYYAPNAQPQRISEEGEPLVLENDMQALADFSKQNDNVDFAGRMVWKDMKDAQGNTLLDNDGKPRRQEVFNFGKYKDRAVTEVLRRDPGYYGWMIAGEFPANTKQVLTRIRLRMMSGGL